MAWCSADALAHIAIQEQLDGKVVDWMEKVSDEQYQARSYKSAILQRSDVDLVGWMQQTSNAQRRMPKSACIVSGL